jgi:cell division transport system permease protein
MKFRGTANKSSVSYAVLSNTIVLVLVGLFLLLFLHINAITNILKEKINVIVEMNDNVSESSIEKLRSTIQANEMVVENSVEYIPNTEAYKVMKGALQTDTSGLGNPFKDVIVYNVKSEYYSDENLKKIAGEIKKSTIVDEVFYENILIDNIKSNLTKASFGILILAIIFIVLSVIIMYNTLNLSFYADRFEIKTMEIIGARDSFIRQPYIKLAGKVAIRSFLISSIIILLILGGTWHYIDGMQDVIKWYFVGMVISVLFIFAITITIIATIRIVNKYLSKEIGDMYE